ncbi:MAG: hypothetical protein FWF81_03925 [Defluviitaleaceae bacterium]|nr:hypothetical protein [Defluviitaleaceae bacterium]
MIITSVTQKIESLAVKLGFLYHFAEKYYIDMVKKESMLAGIGVNDHILCIGGGCCPFSAILFHRTTNAKVTVIDNNPKCVYMAQELVFRLGLDEKINVLLHNGCPSDIKKYSVIHLALQVDPIEQVISDVEYRMTPGTKLLIRRPKKHLCCMYSKFITHKFRNVGRTFMYTAQ